MFFKGTDLQSGSPSSAPSSTEPTSAAPGHFSLRRWWLWSESLYPLGASGGDLPVGKVAGVKVRVEVCVRQLGSYGQPAWPNRAVAAEQVQPVER